ncbi:hypothetical protein NMG60_11001830 [Bertholletia excelsa]
MADSIEPSTPSTPSTCMRKHIRPRREVFEHALIPITKLVFTDGTQTLGRIKDKLVERSIQSPTHRVDALAICEILEISLEHARLVLETIGAVLHSYSDPLVTSMDSEIESVGVNVHDLILFLYVQSYKRLIPRTPKDLASMADVWPSTSAFDGFLSALSPLQLVRSNSRRCMPSQADEEAHHLSYLQKHLASILSLLADSVEAEGEESQVLTLERFQHLEFLIFWGEKESERIPLSQAAPFFANSDPAQPAAPVSVSQVHDWLLENIVTALEQISEKVSAKESGSPRTSDQDIPIAGASESSIKASTSARGPNFVEGISKSSCIMQASDLQGSSVKVINCHDSAIYILAPLRYATVYGCSDTTVVLGAVGKAVRVEHCERVQVVVAARRICISNCRECVFFLGVNQQPLIVGDNHKLQVAPYNTFYPQLEEHMNQVGIQTTINRWDDPVVVGMVDLHDSLSHPPGMSDIQSESATCLDPDQFTNFVVPNYFEGDLSGCTKINPFPLPDGYISSQHRNHKILGELKQSLRETPLEKSRKRELSTAIHIYFKDWLYATGNIRQLYCLQGD